MRASLLIFATLAFWTSTAQAKPTWNRLEVAEARASTYLQNNWNRFSENYHPSYAFDDDAKTAWVEGSEGDGAGQTLEWEVSPLASVRAVKLELRNGYQKSGKLFQANAAPAEVRIDLLNSSHISIFDGKFQLASKEGWQELVIDAPSAKDLRSIRLTILSARPGKQYKDTCISDIRTFVDSEVKYDAGSEKAKKRALKAWISERKKQAAYFKKLPKTFPYASTHFRCDTPEDQVELVKEAGAEKRTGLPFPEQLAKSTLSPMANQRLPEATRKRFSEAASLATEHGESISSASYRPALARRIPRPDGLEILDSVGSGLGFALGFLENDNASFFEAEAKSKIGFKSLSSWSPMAEMAKEWTATPARVAFTDSAKKLPSRMYFTEHLVFEERNVYVTDTDYVLDFDPQGRLSRVVTREIGDERRGFSELSFTRDDAGRVVKLQAFQAVHEELEGEGEEDNVFRSFACSPETTVAQTP